MEPADVARLAWKSMPDVFGRRLSEGSYKVPPHVSLISWLQLLSANRILRRIGVSMPPGHSKSESIDYYGSTWLLEHNHRRRIILASYAATLAEEQAKRVRNLIESNPHLLSVRIAQDSRAADKWRTTAGGGMWAVGIGGSITGRRASDLLIDDPMKNWADAMSETIQASTWNWYGSTARTRLLPRGSIMVVQTRWSEEDLLGKIETADKDRDDWLFVRLPAIAEQNETIDTVLGPYWSTYLREIGVPLPAWHREQGEPLWPELEPGVPWYDLQELGEIRSDIGEMAWAGLYQQRPAPMTSDMFPKEKWVKVDAMPPGPATYVRRWDMAATQDGGDWTVGTLIALHHGNRMLYVIDVVRRRIGSDAVEELVKATAIEDRERYGRVYIRVEREPGSSGKAVESNFLRRVLPGFEVAFLPSTGEKTVRAMPLSAQQQARHVHLCRVEVNGFFETPSWWQPFIDEFTVFPNGKNDDIVDTASLGYVDLIELGPRKSRTVAGSAARRQLGL